MSRFAGAQSFLGHGFQIDRQAHGPEDFGAGLGSVEARGFWGIRVCKIVKDTVNRRRYGRRPAFRQDALVQSLRNVHADFLHPFGITQTAFGAKDGGADLVAA